MIVPIDPADDATMRAAFDVGARSGAVGRPWFQPGTYDSWAIGVREPEPGERSELYAVLDADGSVTGVSRLWVYLSDNTDKLGLDVDVDPDARRRGFGGALVEHAVARAGELGRSLVHAGAHLPGSTAGDIDDDPTVRFARDHGFEPDEVEIARHLDLPVEAALLDRLDPPAGATYRIETFNGHIPDEHLPGLGELMGLLGVDAPTGTVEFEPEIYTPERLREMFDIERRRGRTRLTTLAIAADGTVAAHTDLIVEDDPALPVHQYGTYVHREHRGHRLGTAVKVANLRSLQSEFPGRPFVQTENAETNGYMVDINVALGFRVVEVQPWLVRRL